MSVASTKMTVLVNTCEDTMVNFCAVPSCSNYSDKENYLSYYCLLLKNKAILKQWIHIIGRVNLPLKNHTQECSEHFVNVRGRMLRPDEVPSVNFPCFLRRFAQDHHEDPSLGTSYLKKQKWSCSATHANVNTVLSGADIELLVDQLRGSKESVKNLEEQCADLKQKQHFHFKIFPIMIIPWSFTQGLEHFQQ